MSLADVHVRLFAHFGRPGPWFHLDPVSQLVLGVIGGRTLGEVSQAAFESLYERFRSWEAVRDGVRDDVAAAIAPVTFADEKARRLQAALRMMTENRGRLELDFLRAWPVGDALGWLERLPGVGRKVSAATVNFSTLRMSALVVDTHHLRVAGRLGLTRRRASIFEAYSSLAPRLPACWTAQDLHDHHHLIKTLGQRICRYHAAACRECPLQDLCPAGLISSRRVAIASAGKQPKRILAELGPPPSVRKPAGTAALRPNPPQHIRRDLRAGNGSTYPRVR